MQTARHIVDRNLTSKRNGGVVQSPLSSLGGGRYLYPGWLQNTGTDPRTCGWAKTLMVITHGRKQPLFFLSQCSNTHLYKGYPVVGVGDDLLCFYIVSHPTLLIHPSPLVPRPCSVATPSRYQGQAVLVLLLWHKDKCQWGNMLGSTRLSSYV